MLKSKLFLTFFIILQVLILFKLILLEKKVRKVKSYSVVLVLHM